MQKRLFYFLFITMIILPVGQVSAQFDTLDIFHGGIHDGQLLLNKYIQPWLDAFGDDLNAGWYNTATTHEMGGVDVFVAANMTIVPSAAKTFDLGSLAFDTLQVAGSQTLAPTVAGAPGEGPRLYYRETANGDTVTVANFASPAGTGYDMVMTPYLQVGLGLPAGTEVMGRFMIPIDVPKSSARMSLFGVGVKHSLKQWLVGLEDVPVGVAVFAGYTYFQVYSGFKTEPDDYTFMEDHLPAHFTGQEVRSTLQSFLFDFLLSTDLEYINAFAGLGYGRSWGKTEVNGRIPVPAFIPELSTEKAVYTDDHVYRVPDTKYTLRSSVRLNAGIRLNYSLFAFHASYTWAGTSIYSAGIGMSFR
jgi:hypothetical protein